MKNKDLLFFLFNAAVGFVLQVFLAESRGWMLSWIAAYPYLLPLLLAPMRSSRILLLAFAAFMGLAVDVFYDTLGIHMIAAVSTAYARGWILLTIPLSLQEIQVYPRVAYLGWRWCVVYLNSMLLVHHLFVFFLEAGSFINSAYAWGILVKNVLSSLAFFLILEALRLTYRKRR